MKTRFLLVVAVLVGMALLALSLPGLARPTVVARSAAHTTSTDTPTATSTPPPTETLSPTATETPSATASSTSTATSGSVNYLPLIAKPVAPTPSPTATTGPSSTATTDPSPTATTGPSPTATTGPSSTATTGPSSTATTGPSSTATTGPSPTTMPVAQIPHFSHVFIIMMENEAYDQIIGNTGSAPYINNLAQQYAVAANYYGTTHPSLPNYISLISGDTQGITTNCNDCFVNAPNIADQIEAAGKTWKAYMESMPSPCFVGDSGTLYRQKHNPFIYFDNIRTNPARCAKIVPFTQFNVDLQAGTLPDYIWITPNMCNNIHDCSLKTGDDWLQTWVTKILAAPVWQQNGVLFLTFDESKPSDDTGCCTYAVGGHILTLVISPLAKPAFQSQVAYDHYSLLRTIEQSWGMPLLDKASCDCSQPMSDFFSAASARARP